MAPPRRSIAPELVAEGRRLYEQTVTPVRDIAAKMGISCTTLQNRVDEWGWKRRDYHSNLMRALRAAEIAASSASMPASPEPDPATEPAAPMDRAALAARMQAVVERQMAAADRVLAVLGPANPTEAERTARTLASLARMLREIVAFNQPDEGAAPDAADDDPVPIDIDEFREELARRIRSFVDARQSASSGTCDEIAVRADGGET